MKNKTRIKRGILVLLSILITIAIMIPGNSRVYAATEKTDKATGFVYDTDGVLWRYEGKATDVVVPAKIGGVKIRKLGSCCFFDNQKLKSVTLPEGLTVIGDNVFARCASLTTVKIPSTVKVIEACAFDSCSSLGNITIPNGVTTIGEEAFIYCKSITKINIPNSVRTIGNCAFQDVSITSITIPSGLSSIAPAAFADTPLETVVIPKNIKTIGGQAFYGCKKLTSITIPKTVTKIEYGAFGECPLLTVHGENDTAAMIYCADFNIKFTDGTDSSNTSETVIKSEPITVPATTKAKTVTATPSKTKLAVKNVTKNLVGYTIKGDDYYKLSDLACLLKGTDKEFAPGYDTEHSVTQFNGNFDIATKTSKGDGKKKQAARVYPTIYDGTIDVSGAFSVYSINGEDYYRLADVMNVLDCGAIKNKKTGVINLNPKLSYEPFDSPVFAAVPRGNAAYQKLQKKLYDAYLNGKDKVSAESRLTVPDNTVLYVPRGVTYGNGIKIYLGNNSSFIVKGAWNAEYPDRTLFPVSKSTKNAIYSYGFNPTQPLGEMGANNNIVYVSGKSNFEWGNMPLASAKISYGNVVNGVQPIILNVTRDKRDSETCLFVYFHVKGGESYGHLFNNVNESIDLSQQLAIVAAKNIGKKATIDRVYVQNANGVSFSKHTSIAVDWTISTSGAAPTQLKTVNYSDPFEGNNSLDFAGLSKSSYIAKYPLKKDFAYQIISPDNKYIVAPIQEQGEDDLDIRGESSKIALYTGKKEKTGKNSYSFVISPFSADLSYVGDYGAYPIKATLSTESKSTYLNFELSKSEEPGTSWGGSMDMMIKYHKKGDPADVLGLLYADIVEINEKTEVGKLDLTLTLTDLYNSKGAINIDKLYVYTFGTRTDDDFKIPSNKSVTVPCDITLTPIASVKLGKDTVALIQANPKQASTVSEMITASFKIVNNFYDDLNYIKISPAGKNKWGSNLLKKVLGSGDSVTVKITFDSASPLFDIKAFADYGDPSVNETYIIKNVDLTGITSAGATIALEHDWVNDKLVGTVTNNIPPKPIAAGSCGTDTIDVVLFPGADVKTFDVSDFSLAWDDWPKTPYSDTDIKITGLSQSTGGNAKLTLTRYFDPETESEPYSRELILMYKGYVVGKVQFNN